MNILVDLGRAVALRGSDEELLTLAQRLADGGIVSVLTHAVDPDGTVAQGLVAAVGAFGVSRVFVRAAASDDLSAADTALLEKAIAETGARLVLGTSGSDVTEWFARLSVRFNAAVVTDAVAITEDGLMTKSVLAGSHTTQVRSTTDLTLVTVKPNSVEVEKAAQASSPQLHVLEASAARPAARITSVKPRPVSTRPALTEASVVVAGGRGLDGDFSLVEQLADELGGAVGASRAATDAGWIDHSAQIGQTGVTVSPQLFISVGISGAIQQKAGMQTSRVIVAVNKDEDAQVFEIADYGIVGDFKNVLPQAIEELKRRRS
jgi:electron transfer flavoprotein alpha subunit